MCDYKIREVEIEDAARLAEIYSYYVQNTAVSFEYEAPTAQEFQELGRENGAVSMLIQTEDTSLRNKVNT